MTAPWESAHGVDAVRAAALVGAQFPALAGAPVREVGTGWDNSVLLVGDVLFRFPRREMALDGLRRELLVLPRVAGRLPLPVPVPTHYGSPADGYPWPFWGAAPLPGRELAGQSQTSRVPAAAALGGFLRALHDLPVDDELRAGLPVDPTSRAAPTARAPITHDWLGQLVAAGAWTRSQQVLAVVDVDPGPSTAELVLVHGDLHPRHLLVDDDVRATGVIDWGDTCLADPSVDLAIAFAAFAGPARAALLAEYGPLDGGTEARARALAVGLCAALAVHAIADGDQARLAEALDGIGRAAD